MTSKSKSLTKLMLAIIIIAMLAYVAFFGVQIGNSFVGGALNMEKSGIKLGFDLSGGSVITYEAATNNVTDEGMETAINNANADANTRIPAENAEADKIKKDAQAEKEALIAEAQGQVARFNSLYEEYVKFPLITKERMFYEAMEEVLPGMNIYITDGSTQTLLPLESFSTIKTNGGQQ